MTPQRSEMDWQNSRQTRSSWDMPQSALHPLTFQRRTRSQSSLRLRIPNPQTLHSPQHPGGKTVAAIPNRRRTNNCRNDMGAGGDPDMRPLQQTPRIIRSTYILWHRSVNLVQEGGARHIKLAKWRQVPGHREFLREEKSVEPSRKGPYKDPRKEGQLSPMWACPDRQSESSVTNYGGPTQKCLDI